MGQKKESESDLIKRLIKDKHPDVWLIGNASIGEKLNYNEHGAFTKKGLITYILSNEKKLIKTGEISWPTEKHGEVDHFAFKSIFSIDGIQFVTGNHGKEVQKFLEGEKKDSFTIKPRPFYRKILGFRSGKRWKQVTAVIGYLLIIFFLIGIFNGNDSENGEKHTNKEKAVETTSEVKNQTTQNKVEKESTSHEQDKQINVSDDQNKNTESKSINANETKSPDSKNRIPVTLIETVDGDTIKVNYKGKEETVRYLLVDTPESKKPGTCVQPYAKAAAERNRELVNSGNLSLEFDNGSERDKYGRLLAYVFVDGKSVQEELLKEGYARVAYIYDPPYKYLSTFENDEKVAQNKHLNIWSDPGYVTDKGFNGCANDQTTNHHTSQTSHPTQGTQSSAGSNYNANTQPTAPSTTTPSTGQTFANCTELRKVHPNGVPSSDPDYQPKLDRDHDNYACERD
jgi:micrococcal nuclease